MVKPLLTTTFIAVLSGCAATAPQSPADAARKAESKISMAIGREAGSFTVTGTEPTEAPTGYSGTRYSVKTADGATFKCDILEPSRLGKLATWGMASGADAMCTEFTPGSGNAGKTNAASCNDLLRAAGKC